MNSSPFKWLIAILGVFLAMKSKLFFNFQFFNSFICNQLLISIEASDCQVTLSIDSSSYTGYIGNSLTITCNGTNLLTNDIVWQYYSLGNSTFVKVIYIYGQIVNGFRRKYSVSSVQSSPNEIMSSLTLSDLDMNDSYYVYVCACNIYTACASGVKAKVEANITSLPATTRNIFFTNVYKVFCIYIFFY